MLQQDRNFFLALAQWGQRHGEGVQSVIEILAQTLVGERFRNVDVGGGQDADVDLDHGAAAEARERLILEDVQQLGLQQRRHLANFIEQDRPFVAEFEFAGLGVRGAGESSGFITEQFAFEQVGGHSRAIHFEEGAVGARRELVDQAGEHFLAGTALTKQKHRNVDVSDESGLRANLFHRGAGSDEEHVVAKFFDLAGVALIFGGADALPDHGVEFGFLEGLGQIVDGAEAHGLHNFSRVVHAGEHDDL